MFDSFACWPTFAWNSYLPPLFCAFLAECGLSIKLDTRLLPCPPFFWHYYALVHWTSFLFAAPDDSLKRPVGETRSALFSHIFPFSKLICAALLGVVFLARLPPSSKLQESSLPPMSILPVLLMRY